MLRTLLAAYLLLGTASVAAHAQSSFASKASDEMKAAASHPDTLRSGGPLSPLQALYDARYHKLQMEIFPDAQAIAVNSTMRIRALGAMDTVEIDFDKRFEISHLDVGGNEASWRFEGAKLLVDLPESAARGDMLDIQINYSGKPHVAINPPWDGGWVWSETPGGDHWIANAQQGSGCDLWWPCKDHQSDKIERLDINVTVPAGLAAATNGVLQSVVKEGEKTTYNWRSNVPMLGYQVSVNVGPFTRLQYSYDSVNGQTFPIEFWALPENEDKARDLIENDLMKQVAFFEELLGPYPWGGEKLGVVETPHLGMEHQTINAYGYQYRKDANGYDWLLHHELAHEWFGNLMTYVGHRDFWLHEAYGEYMQPVYSRYLMGDMSADQMLHDEYLTIGNCYPIVEEGDLYADEVRAGLDVYRKGEWMLRTLRIYLGDDKFWRITRKALYGTEEPWNLTWPIEPKFRSTEDYIKIANDIAGEDLTWFFDAYLRTAKAVELVETPVDGGVKLAWRVDGDKPFHLPVPVRVNGVIQKVDMKGGEGFVETAEGDHVTIDPGMTILRSLPIAETCEQRQAAAAARREARRQAAEKRRREAQK